MEGTRLKVLLLSFYFQPDLSAGSFRATMLVKALQAALPQGGLIDVLTTHPNRYGSYAAKAETSEIGDGIRITRVTLPSHKGGMVDQARAFLSYARAVQEYVADKEYDLVVATSSRLMTASLGASIARRKKLPLYLDIRDIFVDTIGVVLPRSLAIVLKPVFSLIERFTIQQAARTNLVSEGFREYFSSRYPTIPLSFFTNGVDEEFIPAPTSLDTSADNRQYIDILYAGNLGDGQGLDIILPALAGRLAGEARFRVIGDGGRRLKLLKALADAEVDNVELLPPMGRKDLVKEYRKCDVLFLHLNSHAAFKKVLPSKIFEYGASGKPILAGIDGYAAAFTRDQLTNAAIFNPCDAEGGVRALSSLKLEETDRSDFIRRYARASIMRAMAADIIGVAVGKQ